MLTVRGLKVNHVASFYVSRVVFCLFALLFPYIIVRVSFRRLSKGMEEGGGGRGLPWKLYLWLAEVASAWCYNYFTSNVKQLQTHRFVVGL